LSYDARPYFRVHYGKDGDKEDMDVDEVKRYFRIIIIIVIIVENIVRTYIYHSYYYLTHIVG
jgi:hypothetical protein